MNFYPILGPPCVRSNTWRGLRSHWNFCKSLAPWLPPLFGLIKTNTGDRLAVGMGLMTNVRGSLDCDFFLPVGFFFGVLRRDDLKLPFRGNLTIHEGGTIIREWVPEEYSLLMRLWWTTSYYFLNNIKTLKSS